MPTDDERRELLAALEQALGERAAATLMESLHPEPWDHLATNADLLAVKADLADVKADVGVLKTDVAELKLDLRESPAEVFEFKAEMRANFAEMQANFAGIVPKLVVASLGTAASFYALMLAGFAVFS